MSPLDNAGQQHLVDRGDRARVLVVGAGEGLDVPAQVGQVDDFVDEAAFAAVGRP